jgi:hypothetical protein
MKPTRMQLDLRFNPELSNIQALFENPGIGAGDVQTRSDCQKKEQKFVKKYFLLAPLPPDRDKEVRSLSSIRV